MKALFRIIIILVVIIALLLVGRNIIAKFVVEKGVQTATGLSLRIAKLDLGLTTTHIGISGLELYNPKGFVDKVMFHVPEAFVDYNLGAMVTGKIHLQDVRLDLDKFVVVKNEKGQINLEALKLKSKEGQPQKKAEKKETAKDQKIPDVQIDHLMFKVGTVIYKDYSKGGNPVVNEYKINISEEISNVTDARALFGLIAERVLTKAALGSLLDFNIDLVDTAVGIPQETVNTLKNAAESITEKLKLPFGEQK